MKIDCKWISKISLESFYLVDWFKGWGQKIKCRGGKCFEDTFNSAENTLCLLYFLQSIKRFQKPLNKICQNECMSVSIFYKPYFPLYIIITMMNYILTTIIHIVHWLLGELYIFNSPCEYGLITSPASNSSFNEQKNYSAGALLLHSHK